MSDLTCVISRGVLLLLSFVCFVVVVVEYL